MRFVAIADSDSYLKWSASFRPALPDGWEFRQLVVESPVVVSDNQLAAAVSVGGVDPAEVSRITALELPEVLGALRPDVVLVALRGPGAQVVIRVATEVADRPVVIAGLPGISVPATRKALVFRRQADLFLLHSKREMREFAELAHARGWDREFGLATLPFVERRRAAGGTDLVFAVQAIVPRVHGDRVRVARMLVAAAEADPTRRVVVKLRAATGERQTHDEEDGYPELLAALGPLPPNLVLSTASMSTALDSAEGLVTVSSTAAIEAIARGVPVIVLDVFGVSARLINLVFEGSGLFGDESDVIARRFRHPDPGWLDDNYFHEVGDADAVRRIVALAQARRRGELSPAPASRQRGGRLRLAWHRQRAFGVDGTWTGRLALAVGHPARLAVRALRRVRRALRRIPAPTMSRSPGSAPASWTMEDGAPTEARGRDPREAHPADAAASPAEGSVGAAAAVAGPTAR
jgi:hypothetical protein